MYSLVSIEFPVPTSGRATVGYRIHVTINTDGTWSYEEEGLLQIPGRDEIFRHTDRNTLTRIAEPTPNPLASENLAESEQSRE